MKQRYSVVMDDGTYCFLYAESAGNAIMKALKEHRGRRVSRCYLGDAMGLGGRVNFDIPPHEPLARHTPRKRTKPPAELFSDTMVLDESERAKSKHEAHSQ